MIKMALQSLHEMIRNLSAYIKSLEVLCECGMTLSKNFERLLSHAGGGSNIAGGSSSSGTIDSDTLSQSVATWELAHKIATADTNSLISELLPLLQETVQNVMKDPNAIQSSNTYEVFRSCFSAFFQIQWRFCQLYLSCASTQSQSSSGPLRSPTDPHLARSPTLASFSSSSLSGDRRESTESCMSAFSLPRSSISGMSSISSRSSSPLPGMGHYHSHHYGFGGRSRTSSIFESNPSMKFTPSQPPSPMMPYGAEGSFQPNLFRRWSAYSNTSSGSGHSGSGSGVGSSLSGMGSFGSGERERFSISGGSGGSGGGGNGTSLSSPMSYASVSGFSRRWSVPASSSVSQQSSESGGKKGGDSQELDDALFNAINLLSIKPPTPTHMIPTLQESHGEYGDLESEEPQTTALWPPSDTMPGVVLTTCGTEGDPTGGQLQVVGPTLGGGHLDPQSSLRVPFSGVGGLDPNLGGGGGVGGMGLSPTGPLGPARGSGAVPVSGSTGSGSSSTLFSSQIPRSTGSSGEYSLFGSTPTTTSGP